MFCPRKRYAINPMKGRKYNKSSHAHTLLGFRLSKNTIIIAKIKFQISI
jgi:hypothetical protein